MMISLTQAAINHLTHLNKPVLKVFVLGGGCKGLQAKMRLETHLNPQDTILYDEAGIKVVSDERSSKFLLGTMLDYSNELMDAGFKFNIPGTSSCGCGKSFG